MALNGEGSAFASVFHAFGYVAEELDPGLPGKCGAAAGSAPDEAGEAPGASGPAADEATVEAVREDPFEHLEELGTAVGVAAGGWLVARLLRPRPVSWPRVVVAGVAATALSDLVNHLERRFVGGTEGPVPDEPEAPAETLMRYASGLGMAVAYASVIYPRMPGPPLARGLTFGMLEAATAESGGTLGLLRQISPQISFPLDRLAGPLPVQGSPLASLAFGLGLGLLYRDGRKRKRED